MFQGEILPPYKLLEIYTGLNIQVKGLEKFKLLYDIKNTRALETCLNLVY